MLSYVVMIKDNGGYELNSKFVFLNDRKEIWNIVEFEKDSDTVWSNPDRENIKQYHHSLSDLELIFFDTLKRALITRTQVASHHRAHTTFDIILVLQNNESVKELGLSQIPKSVVVSDYQKLDIVINAKLYSDLMSKIY